MFQVRSHGRGGQGVVTAADCLVLALVQDADLAVLDGVPGVTFSGGTVDVG